MLYTVVQRDGQCHADIEAPACQVDSCYEQRQLMRDLHVVHCRSRHSVWMVCVHLRGHHTHDAVHPLQHRWALLRQLCHSAAASADSAAGYVPCTTGSSGALAKGATREYSAISCQVPFEHEAYLLLLKGSGTEYTELVYTRVPVWLKSRRSNHMMQARQRIVCTIFERFSPASARGSQRHD